MFADAQAFGPRAAVDFEKVSLHTTLRQVRLTETHPRNGGYQLNARFCGSFVRVQRSSMLCDFIGLRTQQCSWLPVIVNS